MAHVQNGGTKMSDRESELARLGIKPVAEPTSTELKAEYCDSISAGGLTIPSLSAYGEFTPITVSSSTAFRQHANLERNK